MKNILSKLRNMGSLKSISEVDLCCTEIVAQLNEFAIIDPGKKDMVRDLKHKELLTISSFCKERFTGNRIVSLDNYEDALLRFLELIDECVE